MENSMTVSRMEELRCLEERLGVKFNNINHLEMALTHSSYANESRRNMMHNERLEFLGDAVLDLASSTYLYEHFPQLTEGELTKTRAGIVCSATLAKLAERLELGKALRLGHGEERSGGRTRTSNLEDVFEAVIGAIYLDQGWEIARDYVFRQLAPEFEGVAAGRILRDYKTVLQEVVHRNPANKLSYVELSATGPDHDRSYEFAVCINDEVYGKGKGHNKKEAEQMAAKEALERLEGAGKKKKHFSVRNREIILDKVSSS